MYLRMKEVECKQASVPPHGRADAGAVHAVAAEALLALIQKPSAGPTCLQSAPATPKQTNIAQ